MSASQQLSLRHPFPPSKPLSSKRTHLLVPPQTFLHPALSTESWAQGEMVLIPTFLLISYSPNSLAAEFKKWRCFSPEFENFPCSSVLCSRSSCPSCPLDCEHHEGKDLTSVVLYCVTCTKCRKQSWSGVNAQSPEPVTESVCFFLRKHLVLQTQLTGMPVAMKMKVLEESALAGFLL